MFRRFFWPTLAALLVWIPGSVYTSYQFSRRVQLSGPDQHSYTPFIDSMTQTLQAWAAPAFLSFVTVFVFQRWREDVRDARRKRIE